MRPKSIAPTESRLADLPRSTRMPTAKNNANGMVAATISALRRLPRKTHCRKISAMPYAMLCSTVRVVISIEVLAIVDALDAHARRKDGGIVDALDLALDLLDRRHALLAAAHQHDALDDVVVAVLAGDAQARLLPDGDRGDVLDQDRIAAALGEHGVAQVLDRANEADAAHHRRLRADIDGVAADIDVAVAHRLQQLRQREPVGDELVEIDLARRSWSCHPSR